jgi:hypothetical protein
VSRPVGDEFLCRKNAAVTKRNQFLKGSRPQGELQGSPLRCPTSDCNDSAVHRRSHGLQLGSRPRWLSARLGSSTGGSRRAVRSGMTTACDPFGRVSVRLGLKDISPLKCPSCGSRRAALVFHMPKQTQVQRARARGTCRETVTTSRMPRGHPWQ